jgi:SAM-dependent methyltransferase
LIEAGALDPMEFTGERMVPERAPARVFWEHIYRYRFASGFVKEKRVLDIACGEGYGAAALLKAGAATVIGVDISTEVCEHARRKYDVDARTGSAHDIPLPVRSVDVVVSFETVEHVDKPELFLDECARCLVPGGLLIISTPDREICGESGSSNPFHCSELSQDELVSMIISRFKRWRTYTQRPVSAPWWSLRSISALSSPWLNVRGFTRLRESLTDLACPHIKDEPDERYRQFPVNAVLAKDPWLSSLVNQYAVRRRGRETAEYVVVVAEL